MLCACAQQHWVMCVCAYGSVNAEKCDLLIGGLRIDIATGGLGCKRVQKSVDLCEKV